MASKTKLDRLSDELDALVQKWAATQRSYLSYRPAEVGHHYYGRRMELLRWDLLNIIPLTDEEHKLYHSGKILIEIKNPFRELYLAQRAAMDYKQYLLENQLSKEEFMLQCKEKIERELK